MLTCIRFYCPCLHHTPPDISKSTSKQWHKQGSDEGRSTPQFCRLLCTSSLGSSKAGFSLLGCFGPCPSQPPMQFRLQQPAYAVPTRGSLDGSEVHIAAPKSQGGLWSLQESTLLTPRSCPGSLVSKFGATLSCSYPRCARNNARRGWNP